MFVEKTQQRGEQMDFDYRKLNGRIVEKLGTKEAFAKKIGKSRTTVIQKLNNSINFSQNEIIKSCEVLEIDPIEIPVYFFTKKVEKTQ